MVQSSTPIKTEDDGDQAPLELRDPHQGHAADATTSGKDPTKRDIYWSFPRVKQNAANLMCCHADRGVVS